MLRSLIYRDWVLNRLHLLIVLGIFSLFQIYFVLRVDSARMWILFSGFYLAFQTFVPFSREDKFRSGAWTCTLPVSRAAIVGARWVAAWILILAGFAVALAMGLALPGSRIDMVAALTPDTLLLAAGLISILLLLVLPFTIRYGVAGIMIFAVVAQLLGAALLVATILTGGGAMGVGRVVHRTIEGTRTGLLAAQGAMTPGAFHLAALAAVLLVNWAGYRLAVALYRRREF